MKENTIFKRPFHEEGIEPEINESKDRKNLPVNSSPEVPWEEDDDKVLIEKEGAHASRKQYLKEKVRGRFVPIEDVPSHRVSENPEDAILEKIDTKAKGEDVSEIETFDEITYEPTLKEKKWIPPGEKDIIRRYSKTKEKISGEAEAELKNFKGGRFTVEQKKKDVIRRKVKEIKNKIQSAIEGKYIKTSREYKKKKKEKQAA